MLSNALKSKINKLWDKFWSRGISNPITAIEQISYLLFMRRMDDADKNAKENSAFAGVKYKTLFIREKLDSDGKPVLNSNGDKVYESAEDCRWSHFSKLAPDDMLRVVSTKAFPFIKNLNDPSQPYTRHMQNAVFIINSSSLLSEAVEIINEVFENIKEQQEAGQ